VTVEPGDSEQAVITLKINPDGREMLQVINVRDGRIVHIQGVRNRREALALAGIPRDASS